LRFVFVLVSVPVFNEFSRYLFGVSDPDPVIDKVDFATVLEKVEVVIDFLVANGFVVLAERIVDDAPDVCFGEAVLVIVVARLDGPPKDPQRTAGVRREASIHTSLLAYLYINGTSDTQPPARQLTSLILNETTEYDDEFSTGARFLPRQYSGRSVLNGISLIL
jgi:hypothetical protein